MSEIRFCCEACGAKLRVGPEYAGRQAKCPKCGQSSTVTAAQESLVPQTQVVVAEDLGPDSASEAFGLKLAKAFGYPFKGSGIVLLAVAAVCLTVLELLSRLPFLWILKLLFGAYLCAYYISVISFSAGGEDELPDWPAVTNLWDDILRPVVFARRSDFGILGTFDHLYPGKSRRTFVGRVGDPTTISLCFCGLVFAVLADEFIDYLLV